MRPIRELLEFASFLFSLWGVLAGISVFLPLVNTWWMGVPLQEAYAKLGTALATATCFFAVLYSFAERHRWRTAFRVARSSSPGWEPENNSLRAAVARFGWALACFIFYLALDVAYRRLVVQGDELFVIIVNLLTPLAIVAYSLQFGLFTAAFGELAVMEYVKGRLDDLMASAEAMARR